jgi:hypothetical protein
MSNFLQARLFPTRQISSSLDIPRIFATIIPVMLEAITY